MSANHCKMCTLTNENVALIRCNTTGGIKANNVLILILELPNQGFLKDIGSIGQQINVKSKGIRMAIY